MTDRAKTQLALANARIRELEAELANERQGHDNWEKEVETAYYWVKQNEARAEKAELEIASCPNKYWHQSVKLRGLVI